MLCFILEEDGAKWGQKSLYVYKCVKMLMLWQLLINCRQLGTTIGTSQITYQNVTSLFVDVVNVIDIA